MQLQKRLGSPCSIFLSASLVYAQAANAAVQVVCNVSIIFSIQPGPIAGIHGTRLGTCDGRVQRPAVCGVKEPALRPRLPKSPVGGNTKT